MQVIPNVLLVLGCIFVTACASREFAQTEKNYSGMSSDEIQLGNAVSMIAQATRPIVQDLSISNHLNAIKYRLLFNTNYRQVPGVIYVMNDNEVYVYSLQNGDVFFSKGFLKLARTEAEVAAVMGHELGHILLHHARKAMEQQLKYVNILSRMEDQSHSLLKNMDATSMQVLRFGKSRENELEADRFMVELLGRSEFDPCACQMIFGKLVGIEKIEHTADDKKGLFDTHPATPERLNLIEQKLVNKQCNNRPMITSLTYIKDVIDRLEVYTQ